jgi:hypothetical protein
MRHERKHAAALATATARPRRSATPGRQDHQLAGRLFRARWRQPMIATVLPQAFPVFRSRSWSLGRGPAEGWGSSGRFLGPVPRAGSSGRVPRAGFLGPVPRGQSCGGARRGRRSPGGAPGAGDYRGAPWAGPLRAGMATGGPGCRCARLGRGAGRRPRRRRPRGRRPRRRCRRSGRGPGRRGRARAAPARRRGSRPAGPR